MNYIVKNRDGPARTGQILFDKKKIITPNILFIDNKRFSAPAFADIVLSEDSSKTKKPILKISDYFFYPKDLSKELHQKTIEINKKNQKDICIVPCNIEVIDEAINDNSALIYVLTNSKQLFLQAKKFVDFIVKLREKIGYNKTIYLPAIAKPESFALFTYMGIDFFDSAQAILAARNKTMLFQTNQNHITELKELPCSCPSCIQYKSEIQNMDFETILNHNYYMIHNEIKHIRNTIKQGGLRNLVEVRIKNNPHLTGILRNLDHNHYSFLEKNTSITSKTQLNATTKESLNRPEILRFQNRIINRYKKPKSAKILVFLPCSAKKPYSFSKTHKKFRDQIFSSGNPFIFHEVIITSPIGIVPRELELIYPASNYDIPVTGIWDEDEKKMIQELTDKYLENNHYEKIISHLPEELTQLIKEKHKNIIHTCIDTPTSEKSLEKLQKTLKEASAGYEKIRGQKRLQEEIHGFAAYQFGRKNADELMKNATIKGKYPYLKIFYKNIQLGMIIKERGSISLTIQGAEKLVKSEEYWVEIFDDFTLTGSVFSPGIKNSDENIRIADEVIIIQKQKLLAVGVAMMNGSEMKTSNHGEAVKIRHII